VLPHTRADATRDRLMETAGSCDTLSVPTMGEWVTYSSISEHHFTDRSKQVARGAGLEDGPALTPL
jgi:hypothetical protein